MPRQMTVAMWNIQNYGSDPRWGTTNMLRNLRNQFIRDFITTEGIGVLLVMEVSTNATPALDNLIIELNTPLHGAAERDWCYSFCGTALENGSADPPANAGSLTFRTDGRTEGYGVIWRSNRPWYELVPGINPIAVQTRFMTKNPKRPTRTPFNLTTRGRTARNIREKVNGRYREFFRPIGGYRTNNVYPYAGNGLMDRWDQLDMPTTGRTNPRDISFTGARRPAYVMLKINKADGSYELVPAGVYHAPSNSGKADLGATLCGLSRELYVINPIRGDGTPDTTQLIHNEKVAYGGDFNFAIDLADWPDSYYSFVNDFMKGWKGGASTQEVPDAGWAPDDRQTTVRLMGNDHTTPITSSNLSAYLAHAIDLVFTRGGTLESRRKNIPETLMVNGNAYAATLGAYRTALNDAAAALPADANHRVVGNGPGPQRRDSGSSPWKSYITGAWGAQLQNWNTLLTDLNNGYFAHARQAAEFFTMFISDHLPLITTITF